MNTRKLSPVKKSLILGTAFGTMALLASILAFGDDQAVVPADQFMVAFWQFLGGFKGLSGMAAVAAVVQIVMLFFKSTLSGFAGKYRLLIVTGLTVVASVVGLMGQGMTLTAALLNGATLTAVQVFAHQLWKQFVEKKEEVAG